MTAKMTSGAQRRTAHRRSVHRSILVRTGSLRPSLVGDGLNDTYPWFKKTGAGLETDCNNSENGSLCTLVAIHFAMMTENGKVPIEDPIREGQILTGALFSEPVRVETVQANGPGVWRAGLVGQQSEKFYRVNLTTDDIATLTIADPVPSYGGDGRLLRIGLQAYALGIAYEFDPYFGLSVSRVDPLPHQLEAVYEYLLKLPSVRFLLADDAGAGKTIMAGLLVRELKLRGLIERVSVSIEFKLVKNIETNFQQILGDLELGDKVRIEKL